jgi:hypothetical protein
MAWKSSKSATFIGESNVDWESDFWADHDEDCHGTIDTDEMREAFPGGFVWDCCQRTGEKTGCKRGPHRPLVANKHARY